jgi:prolipoprotein diacylglyceryltransferase
MEQQEKNNVQWIALALFGLGAFAAEFSVELAQHLGVTIEPWSATLSMLVLSIGAVLMVTSQTKRIPLDRIQVRICSLIIGLLLLTLCIAGLVQLRT